jgi:hypothetical protein
MAPSCLAGRTGKSVTGLARQSTGVPRRLFSVNARKTNVLVDKPFN